MTNPLTTLQLSVKHVLSKALHAYADARIGATKAEKHCYKPSDSVLLTFDDYGSAEEVHDILRILGDQGVKGMFFLQGDWAVKEPGLVREIADAGHVIGNHTETHMVLRGAREEDIRREISGGPASTWLRPPQGRYDKRVRAIAASMGYRICYWTIDSRDWTGASAAEMHHTIMTELHPGAVVLFHLHGAHTRELLPTLLHDIKSRGYQLTPMDESWDAPQA